MATMSCEPRDQHFGSFETLRPEKDRSRLVAASWMCAGLTQITTKGSKHRAFFEPFDGAGLDPASQTVQSEAA
jgi:hypothetical protein